MKRLKFFYFIGLTFLTFSVVGQIELEKYTEKYPDKNGVFLDLSRSVEITIDKEGEPIIESTHNEELLFLNDNYKYYTERSLSYTSFSNIKSVSPAVYIPTGEKFKKVKIKEFSVEDDHDGSVFHDDVKKMSFFYKGLEKGGKTSLNYVKEYFEPHFFGTFYFTSYLPVESVKYTIQTPADMEIGFKMFGNEQDKVKYTVVENGGVKTHTWEAVELEDFDSESQSMDISYSATHIQVYIKSYMYKKEQKNVLRGVDDLYSYYRGFVNDVNEEGNEELIALADSLTRDIKDNDDKVRTIYYWVQENIKYVAFEAGLGGFIPRKASLVCDRKYGDCKDMSSVLYTMIKSIGLPVYYTWIGTRSIPYDYNEVPTPAVDNHMICTYFNGTDYVFIDGTGTGMKYGMPTAFIQGKEALVGISETEYKLIRVPVVSMDENTTIDTVYAHIKDGVVFGEGEVSYTGYSSIYLSDYLNNMSAKDLKDFYAGAFKKGNNKCKTEVTEQNGSEDRDAKLAIEYNFEIEDYVRVNGDELYINPFLKKYLSSSKIKLETNKRDKENTYKEKNRNVVYLKVPDGYALEYLPESVSFTHDYFGFDIAFSYDEEKKQVEISTLFIYDYLVHKSEDFPAWNEMIKKLNQAYVELIIFKKK